MSDQKLNISHKLAGVIDRLIKTTSVKSIDLNVFKGAYSANFNIEIKTKRVVPHISTDTKVINCIFTPQLTEIIGSFSKPKVEKISLSEIKTEVKTENLYLIHSGNIANISTVVDVKVEDVFRKFNISSKLNYKTRISEFDFNNIKPKILNIGRLNYPRVINNYYLVKNSIISKKTAQLFFLSQKEQLTYWRKAVMQTKLDPKELELIGVYYNVPYYNLQNFKIDFSQRELKYKLKENSVAKKIKVCDIIIFRDIEKKKGIIIEN